MRWILTLGTVAALGTVTAILWNTEGRAILERFTPLEPKQIHSDRIDIDTLVKMSDPQLMDELVQASKRNVDNTELATFSTGHSHAFIGGGIDDKEVAEAMKQWDFRTSTNSASGNIGPQFAGRTASNTRSSHTGPSSSNNAYSTANDYKYVPRMQRFGLNRTNRLGRVYNSGKRTLWERSRFGQQSREMDRLRAKRDQYQRGKTVVRSR